MWHDIVNKSSGFFRSFGSRKESDEPFLLAAIYSEISVISNLNPHFPPNFEIGEHPDGLYKIFRKIFVTRQEPCQVTLYDCKQGAMEGGECMSPSERRQKLLEVLCLRRHDTCANLAHEFHVCQRTIRYDIEELMCSYPIETVCGRFGGGVRVLDGYYCHQKSFIHALTPKQTVLLKKLRDQLVGDDLDTINSILVQFAP